MSDRAQHVVLFKFPHELTAEEEMEMFSRIQAWPDTIEGFTGLRFGKDVTGRSSGYDYLLLTEFENEELHQAYYTAPAHKEFSDWVLAREAQLIRVDYPLTEQTLMR